MRKKMNIKYSIKYFLERSDGIGSKKIKPSQMIYSYSTRSRYLEVIHKFVDFCLYESINRIDRITSETIKDYFDSLEGYSVKTLKVHMSALKKYFSVLERKDLIQAIEESRSEIISRGRQRTEIQGFVNPQKVI
ncbi:MAG: phage integrase N-terminal SAM-like domain-containing protein, partial [Candidatus Desulfofervidaceae bacterium]|nr:phage integrase N-terminal SAM-like domain-containing protein [Candidatus Desulfofervidaceae bacterium]